MINQNKVKGLLYGNAIGDALGLSAEFLSKKNVGLIYKENITYNNIIQDQHRKLWKKGEWTDDTDMCLVLFNHLLTSESSFVDEQILAKDFRNWYENGLKISDDYTKPACGIGINIGRILNDKYFLKNPKLSSLSISINCASNGAIMRSSVLSLFPNHIYNTISSCKVTHYSEDCIISCLFIVLLLKHLLNDNDINIENTFNKVLLKIVELNYDTVELEKFINIHSLEDLKLNENIGYTYKPLGCAIFALRNHNNSFYNVIQLIIKEGGDADTNCCVAGSVLGAYLGYETIEHFLIDELQNKIYLDKLLFLYNKMERSEIIPDFGWNCNKKIVIPQYEVQNHLKYIIKNNMVDTVYKYTVSSSSLRQSLESMQKLNQLIINSPALEKEYTVYHMSSPDSKISIVKENGLFHTVKENLEEGDIFMENIEYKDTSILSATFDKSYPLSAFSRDLAPLKKDFMDALDDNINMMSFFHIKKYTKKNQKLSDTYYEIWALIQNNISEIIEDFGDDFSIEDLYSYKKAIRPKIKQLKNILMDIYYIDICCCCLFKIKLTNKTGLLIGDASQYPDQYEILLPNSSLFKVNKIYRQTYGVAISPLTYYTSTHKVTINNKQYERYNKLPNDIDYIIKNITVYEIETI
jgi:ADP-ribosylglycohydrolase